MWLVSGKIDFRYSGRERLYGQVLENGEVGDDHSWYLYLVLKILQGVGSEHLLEEGAL